MFKPSANIEDRRYNDEIDPQSALERMLPAGFLGVNSTDPRWQQRKQPTVVGLFPEQYQAPPRATALGQAAGLDYLDNYAAAQDMAGEDTTLADMFFRRAPTVGWR